MLPVSEETRRAITVMHDGNVHTEIVESGPEVSDEQAFHLMNEIKEKLAKIGLRFGMEVQGWPPENIEELARKYEDPY